MHTEKEAQTKWCPMVRVGNDNQSAENRNCRLAEVSDGPGKGAVWNCCIASSCMMWRWENIPHRNSYICYDQDAREEPPRPELVPPDYEFYPADDKRFAMWIETEESAMKRATGYCGLGGKP